MNQKAVGNAYLIGPNYAAGKDMMAGVVDRDSPGRILSSVRIAIIAVAIAVALLLYLVVMHTRVGMLIRAGASNLKWSVRSASTSNRSIRLCSASGRLSRVLLD
jgi:branched-subunit amino acid ABC-type transport system permease component